MLIKSAFFSSNWPSFSYELATYVGMADLQVDSLKPLAKTT